MAYVSTHLDHQEGITTIPHGSLVRPRKNRFIRLFKEDVTGKKTVSVVKDIVIDGLQTDYLMLVICDPGGSYLLVLAGPYLGYVAKAMISYVF